jgi:drug/metabolite transporter superfamily protein YnfA
VKTLAFVIGLCIFAVGAVGIVAPSALVWIAHRADAPAPLYLVTAIRVAFGVLLLAVAPASRAPRALRAVAVIPLVAAIAMPILGVERARATIEWWTQQGSAVVRLTGIPLLALGGFVAYACAPGESVSRRRSG